MECNIDSNEHECDQYPNQAAYALLPEVSYDSQQQTVPIERTKPVESRGFLTESCTEEHFNYGIDDMNSLADDSLSWVNCHVSMSGNIQVSTQNLTDPFQPTTTLHYAQDIMHPASLRNTNTNLEKVVLDIDVPLGYSDKKSTTAHQIWRQLVRGHRRVISNPEEADDLIHRLTDILSQNPKLHPLPRPPKILVRVENETDETLRWIRMVKRGPKTTFWKEATFQDIQKDVSNKRHSAVHFKNFKGKLVEVIEQARQELAVLSHERFSTMGIGNKARTTKIGKRFKEMESILDHLSKYPFGTGSDLSSDFAHNNEKHLISLIHDNFSTLMRSLTQFSVSPSASSSADTTPPETFAAGDRKRSNEGDPSSCGRRKPQEKGGDAMEQGSVFSGAHAPAIKLSRSLLTVEDTGWSSATDKDAANDAENSDLSDDTSDHGDSIDDVGS